MNLQRYVARASNNVALAANHLGTIAAVGLDPLPRAIAGLAAGVASASSPR